MFLLWRGRRVDLTGRTVTVGRRGRNDVVIRGDPFVSKSHCIITNGALRDTSKNGTRVNGSRVEEHTLNPGDCIRIGNAVLEVHGPGEHSSSNEGKYSPSRESNGHLLSQAESRVTLNKIIQRRAQTERKVKCMIQLLDAFSNSKGSRSRTCRIQDRYWGKKEDQILRSEKSGLRMRLLSSIHRERRNRLNFYRRTLRHLRRTERSRRRLARSWQNMFTEDTEKKI